MCKQQVPCSAVGLSHWLVVVLLFCFFLFLVFVFVFFPIISLVTNDRNLTFSTQLHFTQTLPLALQKWLHKIDTWTVN